MSLLFDELYHAAKTNSQDRTYKSYLKIVKRARRAADRGKFYINVNKDIEQGVFSLLMQQELSLSFHTGQGFIVPYAYWRISWEKTPAQLMASKKDDKNETT